MRQAGIEVQIGTYSLHLQPLFKQGAYCDIKGNMSGSKYAFEHCLTLPLYHELTLDDQEYVVQQLLKAIG